VEMVNFVSTNPSITLILTFSNKNGISLAPVFPYPKKFKFKSVKLSKNVQFYFKVLK
jgi:hypothetical protein